MNDTSHILPPIILMYAYEPNCGSTMLSTHIISHLLYQQKQILSVDLTPKQRSLTHYLENRKRYLDKRNISLPIPTHMVVTAGQLQTLSQTGSEELLSHFKEACPDADYIVIDGACPSLPLAALISGMAHSVVIPFICPNTMEEIAPLIGSFAQQLPDTNASRPYPLFIANRIPASFKKPISSKKKEQDSILTLGFGFNERSMYHELFLRGLTLSDIFAEKSGISVDLAYVAARGELNLLMHHIMQHCLHTNLQV